MVQANARQFFIAAILLAVLLVAVFSFLNPFIQSKDAALFASASSTANSSYNSIVDACDVNPDSDSCKLQIGGQKTDFETIIDISVGLISAGVGALNTLWNSAGTVVTLFNVLGNTLNVPSWVLGLFSCIIMTVLAFILIDFWRRWYS